VAGILVLDEVILEGDGVRDSFPSCEDCFVIEVGGINRLGGNGREEDSERKQSRAGLNRPSAAHSGIGARTAKILVSTYLGAAASRGLVGES
jgi:hypothetical protein